MNYSLLVMESAGMMKMATEEGFPLRQGAGTGLDWFSVATEASGGGTPNLFCSPRFLGYMGIYGRKKYVDGPLGCPRGRGRAPHPHEQGVGPLTLFLLLVFFINSKKLLRGFLGHSENFYF